MDTAERIRDEKKKPTTATLEKTDAGSTWTQKRVYDVNIRYRCNAD